MALVLADRVRDTTTTTGTGTVTLSGTAPTGYQNFSAIGNGNTCYYTINGGSQWEVGIGTYSSTGPTLARTTVLASSNSGSAVDFAVGTKDVFVTYPAEKSIADGYGLLPVANGGTGATSLTSGYVLKGNGTSAVSASVIYDNGTNVGIGIVPSTKLDVAGPIWSRPGGSVGAVASITADASSGANGITLSASFVTGGYGPMKFQTSDLERMRIDSSGNVGIGTSSPLSRFTVSQTGTATISLESAGSWNAGMGATSTGSLIFYNPLATERMRIDSSGNVGIGTTSPQSKMEIRATSGGSVFNALTLSNYVGASAGTGVALYFDPNGAGTLARAASIQSVQATSGNYADLRFYTANSDTPAERMRIDTSGNVSIGNSFGNARLRITAASNVNAPTLGSVVNYPAFLSNTDGGYGLGIGTNASDGHVWLQAQRTDGTATAYNITLNEAGGNVGIGTSSPASLFHVKRGSNATEVYPSGTWASRIINATDASGENGLLVGNRWAGTGSTVFEVGSIFGGGTGSWYSYYSIDGVGQSIWSNAGTERMRLDTSGNVGIGTSSPGDRLDVAGGNIRIANNYNLLFRNAAGTGTARFVLQSDDNFVVYNAATAPIMSFGQGANPYVVYGANANYRMVVDPGGSNINWITAGAERMRLGSNGSLAIGGTGTDATLHIQQSYGGYDRLTQIAPSGTSKNAFNIMAAKNSGGSDNWWTWGVRTDAVWCLIPGVDSAMTSSTGVYFDSTAQAYKPGGGSWQATSDARVKTNIAPITDAASRIMALKPSSFDYRAPEAHAGRVSDRGFIAQEFEEVYPHSVGEIGLICDEEKDLLPEGEKLKTLGLNNDFFADLVAVMQEQQSTISELRARVAQLEGK